MYIYIQMYSNWWNNLNMLHSSTNRLYVYYAPCTMPIYSCPGTSKQPRHHRQCLGETFFVFLCLKNNIQSNSTCMTEISIVQVVNLFQIHTKCYGALHLLMQRNLYTCWLTFFGYGNDYLPQMFTGPKSKTTRSQALSLRREWNINWQLLRLLIKEAEMINSIGEARYLDVYFSTRLGSNGHALFLGGWSLLLWWKHGS